MMTATERLVEAVVYASDEDVAWYEIFSSRLEARRVLRAAANETPEPEQISQLVAFTEFEDMFGDYTVYDMYIKILSYLKEELDNE